MLSVIVVAIFLQSTWYVVLKNVDPWFQGSFTGGWGGGGKLPDPRGPANDLTHNAEWSNFSSGVRRTPSIKRTVQGSKLKKILHRNLQVIPKI